MKKILIVDDEPYIIRLLSKKLEKENYTVYSAENGFESVEMAKKYNPDLILMDIKMPECNGIEAFKILKKTQNTNEIPVLFMTAFPNPEYLKKIKQMGAKGCISKPFIDQNFEDSVRQALN